MKVKFTAGRISGATCPPDRQSIFIWDSDSKGFGLKVSSGGARQFVLESRLRSGKTVRLTIGSPLMWDIESARKEARRLQTLIDQGIDPREQARQEEKEKSAASAARTQACREAEERQRYSLKALFDAYTTMLDARGKTRSANSARSAFKCHVQTPHPGLAAKPAEEVTALEVAAAIRQVHEAGKVRMAGVLRSYLSAAFNAAKKAPFDPTLPSSLIPFKVTHNPVDAIPAVPVSAGQRTLSADELRQYLTNLSDTLDDQALLLALRCGGQRMAQLLRARISDFDPTTDVLRLWDGKGKRRAPREHLLPLGPAAAAQVKGLVERAKANETDRARCMNRPPDFSGLWLFSTRGKVAMIPETPGKRLAEIASGMKCEPFDLRDIRRTVETMMAGMKISKDNRAQVLSHGISGIQSTHYDRYAYIDEKRAALVAWERKLSVIENGDLTPTKVVPLKTHRMQ